jgi:hypothetical protein
MSSCVAAAARAAPQRPKERAARAVAVLKDMQGFHAIPRVTTATFSGGDFSIQPDGICRPEIGRLCDASMAMKDRRPNDSGRPSASLGTV